MDTIVARKTWRTLEPYHGLIYFTPEVAEACQRFGIEGFDSYFATRAAPMGAVPAEVVIAAFFNFHPDLVRHAIPAVWSMATPEQLVAARRDAASAALRRVLGDAIDTAATVAAPLARAAADACPVHGRPLFAGHAALAWPDDAPVALWHAIALLREFRGDGHVACLVEADLGPCEALVLHSATGDVPPALLRATRGWPDTEWDAAVDRLRSRDLIDGDGAFTLAGREFREAIEARTDELAMAPWRAIGEDAAERLRAAVRPLSKAIVASGALSL